MKKEIIITAELSNQVEYMVLLAIKMAEINTNYPACWAILRKQFRFETFFDSNFIEDDIENIKIKLFAEIISKNTMDKKLQEKLVEKELKKRTLSNPMGRQTLRTAEIR